ncbi:ABC transporter ATP-binding protein [Pseudoalteromonas phenolica]|uniref:ABC transporter n=1 Tax=Pseudoalteromonas phenolica TaxID=161398 RepID=A0A0S2K7A7_9GAMM|nr:ABC transporter ATP-binding protein [Pseudoalteromonas phenolica]ALO43982.1 ABC transporter [Pseudoalteromonas phenolica]MBE0356956.1 putative ABC transport system ATP-binding protein [Pseudoalteromonas phenolica O-BC30]RXE96119.1 ABC transporter ATP-binding protein [Pseudoalteromonas phenolica O-BC30]TMO58047.1 ABC transporter ATP-binding protein [Pseudoalteromonas phenolica]
MINLTNISKIFRTESVETHALDSVSLHVERGEFVAIMGQSGSGKSTLLNIVGMLDHIDQGEYIFDGKNISGFTENKLADIRKDNIGFIFQSFNLIDELTVFENVELPLVYQGIAKKEREQRVLAILEKVDIAHRKDHYPQQLSGGQQQRVAVGRAIVAEPKMLLADEPTGNLDSKNGEEVMKLLAQLNREGVTIVMVTHSDHHANYAHRVINVLDGHIVSQNMQEVRCA